MDFGGLSSTVENSSSFHLSSLFSFLSALIMCVVLYFSSIYFLRRDKAPAVYEDGGAKLKNSG